MGIIYGVMPNDEDQRKMNRCYEMIKEYVAKKSGCNRYIQLSKEMGGGIAFAGTLTKPELIVEVGMLKHKRNKYLYISLFYDDEEDTYDEMDFQTIEECIDCCVSQIARYMNKIIKFETVYKKHESISSIEWECNQGEWKKIYEDVIDWSNYKILKRFITKDKREEKVITFSFGEDV